MMTASSMRRASLSAPNVPRETCSGIQIVRPSASGEPGGGGMQAWQRRSSATTGTETRKHLTRST
eukprot:10934903-Alexandrium_andersonii.AAC.1